MTAIALTKPLHTARRISGTIGMSLISPFLLLLTWELLGRAGLLDGRFFPVPTQILQALVELAVKGELYAHVSASFFRILLGFLLGAVAGAVLGLSMGLFAWVRYAVDPIVASTYPIPKIAVLPLIMLIFGIGETSRIVIVAVSVFYLVLINTVAGVLNIDRIYWDVGRNFGVSRLDLYRTIAIPGALPMIFTGVKLGLGVALVVLIAAEFVGSEAGIGYLIWRSWEVFFIDEMYAGLIIIGAFGWASSLLLGLIEKALIPWKH